MRTQQLSKLLIAAALVAGPTKTPDDSRVARKVRHRLPMLRYYGIFDDLAFRPEGNSVTLVG